MKSSDLCRFYSESLDREAKRINPAFLTEKDYPAMLFTKDEVSLDTKKYRIKIPGLGSMNIEKDPTLHQVPDFDWVAVVYDQTDNAWGLVLGSGNPYLPENSQGLPMKNGTVIAVPATSNQLNQF